MAHRAKMTDEAFVAMGRCRDDEEFFESFEKNFGIDVREASQRARSTL